jgi:hypothetical protein
MLTFLESPDIFLEYPQIFVHVSCCVGLEKSFVTRKMKKIWPNYFSEYARLTIRHHLQVGCCYLFPHSSLLQIILNIMQPHK